MNNNNKYLIVPELMNKLLIVKVNMNSQFVLTNNFKINNAKDFKLMKNIIGMELLLGQRPKILASLIGKKSLIINLIVSTNNRKLFDWLSFLQKEPVVWNAYLNNFNLFEKGFLLPSLIVKNLRFNITLKSKKINKLDNYIKSALLD